MADFDYLPLQKIAADLIKQFGRQAQIRSQHSAPDPTEPWKPGAPTEDVAIIKAVFVKYKEMYVNGEEIQMGDQYVLVAGTVPIDPNLKGTIVDGILDTDPIWKIIKIQPIKPGPIEMLYKIQVRK